MNSPRLLTQEITRRRTPPAVTRQRARTEATRTKLLAAAEKTFARDGFEAARLEDIASQAGYTRGAFYANFKSKEDIFFALLEQWVGRRISDVSAVLARENTPAKRLRALAHIALADGMPRPELRAAHARAAARSVLAHARRLAALCSPVQAPACESIRSTIER